MRVFLALLVTLALTSSVAAEPGLKAESGWIREAPPVAPVRAGYLRLTNESNIDLVIVGVRSDAFGAIEIHEMSASDDGTMRMRPVPYFTVPAGGAVALEPGGLHLMLFRPQISLMSGVEVAIVFRLESGVEIETLLKQH